MGGSHLSNSTFFWLLVIVTLSVVLSHLYHRRKITNQVESGAAIAREILNLTSEGIITTNESGEITKFNRTAERIFGYTSNSIIGKHFLSLLPQETHQKYHDLMSGASSNTTSHNYELIACRADGTPFPSILTVTVMQENGKSFFVGMCRDISALKQAEANSLKSQRLMEFLLQSSPVVFYTCKVKNGFPITYVSPNVEKLLGYKPEAITSAVAFWPRHVHPDDRDCVQSSQTSLLKEGREELEYRLKLPDGSYHWIADIRTMVNDENGKPSLLVGCWTDINDEKEAAINLVLKEERLRVSLKCANLATWEWVVSTGKITWSGHINEQLGLSEKLATDFDDFSEIAHPEDREALLTAFRSCLVKDESLNIEYRVLWPDKSIHWVQLVGELINDESGNPVRMAGVLFDITAQKQLRIATPISSKRAS